MKDPGCGPEACAVLDGRLWHATSVHDLRGIRRDRVIAPGNRYRGSFVSAHGWVSLFDFGPAARDEWDQWAHWAPWFGRTHESNLSVWLEVDRKAEKDRIYDAEELRLSWRREVDRCVEEGSGEPWVGIIIPGVEACYRGSLPLELVERVAIMRSDYSVVADLGRLENIEEQTIDMLLET